MKTKHLFFAFAVDPSLGGIENYLFQLIEQYKKKNRSYSLILFPSLSSSWQKVAKLLYFGKIFYHLLFSKDYIIHCTHLHLLKMLLFWNKLFQKKIILYLYGIEFWGDIQNKYRLTPDTIHHIITISEFSLQQIHFFSDKEKMTILPPFIRFSQERPKASKNTSFIFLTVGRMSSLERYKGHEEVIRAIKKIQEDLDRPHRNFTYHIVGGGDDVPRLQEISKNLGLEEIILFKGKLPEKELEVEYKNAHAFIMPARVEIGPSKVSGEGFGIVFLEASLYSLPLIGPREGGSTDIIEEGKNGLLVDPQNIDDIKDKMMILLENPELCVRLGNGAYEMAREKFSEEEFQKKLERFWSLCT